jgi:hypothetical protein
VGDPVVLGQVGVVDGDHLDPLVELVDRVAPVAHHPLHQLVGVGDGGRGLVDEPLLDGTPLLGVALPHGRVEVDDLEGVAALGPPGELGFGTAPVALLGDDPVVLGTEPLLQRAGPHPGRQQRAGHDQDDDDHTNDQPGHEASPLSLIVYPPPGSGYGE